MLYESSALRGDDVDSGSDGAGVPPADTGAPLGDAGPCATPEGVRICGGSHSCPWLTTAECSGGCVPTGADGTTGVCWTDLPDKGTRLAEHAQPAAALRAGEDVHVEGATEQSRPVHARGRGIERAAEQPAPVPHGEHVGREHDGVRAERYGTSRLARLAPGSDRIHPRPPALPAHVVVLDDPPLAADVRDGGPPAAVTSWLEMSGAPRPAPPMKRGETGGRRSLRLHFTSGMVIGRLQSPAPPLGVTAR
jgi:hypothetical protein